MDRPGGPTWLSGERTQDKADSKAPLIVVECKADNITIKPADYAQGETYALHCNAPFFVTHNNRETRYWRTRKERMPAMSRKSRTSPCRRQRQANPRANRKLKTFKEDEIADLLIPVTT